MVLALAGAAAVAAAFGGALTGCGGGHTSSPAASLSGDGSAGVASAVGRAVVSVLWPAPSTRLIPAAANSIEVRVTTADGSAVLGRALMARPAGGGTTTASFDRLPVGVVAVAATAYPGSDGSGTAQAQASATATIARDQVASVALTMNSTIASLDIAALAMLTVGQQETLTATARDASGNVVLITPNTLKWSTSDAGIASIDTATGTATAVAAGQATITVSETESGKTASALLAVSAPTPSPTPTPLPSSSLPKATAYQIDPAHSGSISFGQTLHFPAAPTWSVTLAGSILYPLIVDGRVFAATSSSLSTTSQLYALNEATGQILWGPIPLNGACYGITYDNGKIFTITTANVAVIVKAYDAATGNAGWSATLPLIYDTAAAPTAAAGIVYATGSGGAKTLFALDESSGNILWSGATDGGDQSIPTVSSDAFGNPTGVYVDYPLQVYDFDPKTGSLLWHYDGPGSGGGGYTASYADGRLFAPDIPPFYSGHIFDSQSGATLGTLSSSHIPAIGHASYYLLNGSTLQSVDIASGQVNWSFAGDGTLMADPILIDQTVIVGSGAGKVYAVDAASGSLLWTGSPGGNVAGSYGNHGLAAGEGYLVVPSGTTLSAWKLVSP